MSIARTQHLVDNTPLSQIFEIQFGTLEIRFGFFRLFFHFLFWVGFFSNLRALSFLSFLYSLFLLGFVDLLLKLLKPRRLGALCVVLGFASTLLACITVFQCQLGVLTLGTGIFLLCFSKFIFVKPRVIADILPSSPFFVPLFVAAEHVEDLGGHRCVPSLVRVPCLKESAHNSFIVFCVHERHLVQVLFHFSNGVNVVFW
mmetsp:Transcript_36024/g.71293  ORF Transcript_36024/g.71293 Transcript_36024/m.71293 type:complete len:201 (+) Transcript_36024:284-886(+)